MPWNFVSSRRLQTGHRYGVWVTSRGVTSTDEITRWLRSMRWSDVTVLPRGTLATGQMVKEAHAIWGGSDGAVLPSSDRLVGYGPLYLAESPNDDPGDVPSRAPGERPPIDREMQDAMLRSRKRPENLWSVPVLAAVGIGLLLLMGGSGGDDSEEDSPDDGEDGDSMPDETATETS